MILPLGAIILGILTQAILFIGWPMQRPRFRFSLFREGVLAFINEQSLWLMTLIYWYLLWQHSLFVSNGWANRIFVDVSVGVTILVALATFTRITLPKLVNLVLYLWYIGVDLYISLVFLIRSPSNIFIHTESKTLIDYYFFGMISMHLLALIDFVLHYTKSVNLGSRYRDRQVSIFYPFATTLTAYVVLLVIPRFIHITDFAFVGSLLAIGTWITGQRTGIKKS